jgi:hypothetical protein
MQKDDISPADLGNGYTLNFQERPATGEVRAVVKNAAGEIVIRGKLVSKAYAIQSRFDATSQAASLLMPVAEHNPLPMGGFGDASLDDFEEEQEPEEIDDEFV